MDKDMQFALILCGLGLLLLALSILLVRVVLHAIRDGGQGDGDAQPSGGIDIQTGREAYETIHGYRGLIEGTVYETGKQRRSGATVFLEDCLTRHQMRVDIFEKAILGRRIAGGSRINDVGVSSDPSVSRRQFGLWEHDNEVYLFPVGKNPTLLNGRRVENPKRLRTGDMIVVGRTQLRVIAMRGNR